MRYIRKHIIISTVADMELDDDKSIRDLLGRISSGSVDLKIEYRDVRSLTLRDYERCRIISVGDSTINLRIFRAGAQFVVNNIPFENIISITMSSKQRNIVPDKKTMTRFDLIDIPENAEEVVDEKV